MSHFCYVVSRDWHDSLFDIEIPQEVLAVILVERITLSCNLHLEHVNWNFTIRPAGRSRQRVVGTGWSLRSCLMNFAIYNSHRGRHVPTTTTSLAYSNSRAFELQMLSVGGRTFLRLSYGTQLSCRELSSRRRHKTPPWRNALIFLFSCECDVFFALRFVNYSIRIDYVTLLLRGRLRFSYKRKRWDRLTYRLWIFYNVVSNKLKDRNKL